MTQTNRCLATLHPEPASISYGFEELREQSSSIVTTSSSGIDSYATYADNFDLSLLPQAYNNTIEIAAPIPTNTTQTNFGNNVPPTAYNFDITTHKQQQHFQQNKARSLGIPDIKIEQTWSSCPALNTIKQEQSYQSYFPLNTQQHHLVPPAPTYPAHVYPSPQSSPAQSEYNFSHTQYSSSPSSSTCYESLSSSRNSLYTAVSSPCPSIDTQVIKQEQLHILPPSPPESSCETPTPQSSFSISSTGFDLKSEPFDSDVETFNDLRKPHSRSTTQGAGHQLLREYLEDTTFQKRNNLKPLALESFIGGLEEVRDNIEPVISLALEHARREADATCAKLQISQDPSAWSTNQVHAWLRSTLHQYQLPIIDDIENKFKENGAELLQLSEEEFVKRIPECGSTLHAQLEIWKLTYSPENSRNANPNEMSQSTNQNVWTNTVPDTYNNGMEEDTEDEDDFLTTTSSTNNSIQQPALLIANSQFGNSSEVINTNSNGVNNNNSHANNNNEVNAIAAVKRSGTRSGGSHIHLWQFLKELLAAPHINGTAIRWIDRSKGIFKIEDSVRVAKLWGKRKNRPAMNYDKLSRSIRQYYKKGIMKKTERSQRLVYQFCQPYHM